MEITATQTETGISRTTITNETGSYVLPNLPIGPYRLEAALPGFRTYVQTGIVLQVNGSPVINPVLEVGQVTRTGRSSGQCHSGGNTQCRRRPGRRECPHSRTAAERTKCQRTDRAFGSCHPAPPVNGSCRDPFAADKFFRRGRMNIGPELHARRRGSQQSVRQRLPLDAVSRRDAGIQSRNQRHGAQNGVKSAGAVSLVTKSGTNEFHGDLFEFVRNGIFNARNAFATNATR